ncbi:Nn.00g077620.m01.CDS01 [Neocucurbitaria sp. VM-36]
MPKTAVFTTITPLPTGITRKSVLDMYHDHLAMIDLNPLVVERFRCKPPSYAPTDEYYMTWYTIKDKVSYLPGGLATGSVSYHACFHDSDEGLQTHVYAPLGLNIQAKWSVGGRLPGEPKPPAEPGLNTPRHGLYIREDVKMTCSSLLLGFVKKTFKDSHARLVEKLVERAHVLESNFANERLKALRNVDPGERMGHGDIFIAPPPDYLPPGYISQTAAPRYVSHTRSISDPILSPGFSQSSTLTNQSDDLRSSKQHQDRPISFRFILEEKPVSASAPQAGSFLLPATTYDGGFSHRLERPISLYPGSPSHQFSGRDISLLPPSPRNPHTPRTPQYEKQEQQAIFLNPPRVSYTPEERPISFTFPFDPKCPFDRKSTTECAPLEQHNLLDDIDVAIDEVFMCTLPATAYKAHQKTSCDHSTQLPKTTYEVKHERKDSVVPYHAYSDTDLPPVPLKDEKYRKGGKQTT